KALFDVDIWGAVFAHRAQFHKMAVGRKFFDGIQNVERNNVIVCLRDNGVLAVNHGIWRGTLFGKVYDRFGLNVSKDSGKHFIVHRITDVYLDLPSRDFFPSCDPFMKRLDRDQAIEATFKVEMPARQVVEDSDIIPFARKVE